MNLRYNDGYTMFLPTLEAVSKTFMVMGMVRASLFQKPTTNNIIENVPG